MCWADSRNGAACERLHHYYGTSFRKPVELTFALFAAPVLLFLGEGEVNPVSMRMANYSTRSGVLHLWPSLHIIQRYEWQLSFGQTLPVHPIHGYLEGSTKACKGLITVQCNGLKRPLALIEHDYLELICPGGIALGTTHIIYFTSKTLSLSTHSPMKFATMPNHILLVVLYFRE